MKNYPNRTPIYQGRIVDLGLETVQPPDGSAEFQQEVIRHPGGTAVVALDHAGKVCLLRQYRYAAGGWIWEIPAGKPDDDEPPLSAAQRELAEEAGVRAAQWHALGTMLSTPGFCDEVIHLFLARDLAPAPTGLEPHEYIEIHWLPLTQAMAQVMDNTIQDAKTIAALARAAHFLNHS